MQRVVQIVRLQRSQTIKLPPSIQLQHHCVQKSDRENSIVHLLTSASNFLTFETLARRGACGIIFTFPGCLPREEGAGLRIPLPPVLFRPDCFVRAIVERRRKREGVNLSPHIYILSKTRSQCVDDRNMMKIM
jgi:hypothetical protein